MPEPTTLLLFFGAAMALLIVPGPAVLYVIARSVDQGPWAGVVSTLGISVGTLVHVIAAAIGLSAILSSSALAFDIIKYLGAAYLIYLGIKRLMTKDDVVSAKVEKQPLKKIFIQGIWVNILNPKTALFFLAFLPQFADATRGDFTLQIVFLGMFFLVLGILSDSVYALITGSLGNWLRSNPRYLTFQRYFTGGVYLVLGVGAALSGSGRK